MTEFHQVTNAEGSTLVALWERAKPTRPRNPPRDDIMAIRAYPKSAIRVAGIAERIVAGVAVDDGGHRARACDLRSDPTFRGQGWGRRAVEAAKNRARRNSHTGIELLARRSTTPVLTFCDRLGRDESDVTVLQRRLGPKRERAFAEIPDAH